MIGAPPPATESIIPPVIADLFAETFSALPLPALIYGALVTFAAGWLRGYTGFGFALAAVPALSIILEPALIVPVAMLLQFLAGVQLLRKTRHQVEWPVIWPLLIGAAVGTPFGIWLLAALPAAPMRGFIGLILLVAVILLWRGVRFQVNPRSGLTLGIGGLSGILNGGTAIGGPPVVIYFLASARSAAVSRATLLMYFFFLSLGSIVGAVAVGLMTGRMLLLAAVMFPLMTLGNMLGDRRFDRSSEAGYRRLALGFLAVIAIIAVGRAIGDLSASGW